MSTAVVSVRTPSRRLRQATFTWTLRVLALALPALLIALGIQLYRGSLASRRAFGWHFLLSSAWDPVFQHFGAWPFIFGTLFTTAIAILLAAPLGIGVAIFLAELAPAWLRGPLGYLVELLAVVPSVVYGLWGLFVLVPWLQQSAEPWLNTHSFGLEFLQGAPYGVGFLAAGLVLAIMILPFVVLLGRDALRAVPRAQREAGYALGATRWELITGILVPAARSGLAAGVLLAIGRALGETMAVAMLIGNNPAASWSLLAPGYSLASVIANEFTEATSPLYISSLTELALVLFALTLIINLFARGLMVRLARGQVQAA